MIYLSRPIKKTQKQQITFKLQVGKLPFKLYMGCNIELNLHFMILVYITWSDNKGTAILYIMCSGKEKHTDKCDSIQ